MMHTKSLLVKMSWIPILGVNIYTRSSTVPLLASGHAVGAVVHAVFGAALVHSIDPKKCRTTTIRTFHDYSLHVFLPCIVQMLSDVIQVDIVWDVYKRDSL